MAHGIRPWFMYHRTLGPRSPAGLRPGCVRPAHRRVRRLDAVGARLAIDEEMIFMPAYIFYESGFYI